MVKICIIVPVYNVEKYLDRCIQSILEQTYSSFHLLLIDDGSTDEGGNLCDHWAKQDDRISVIHQVNQGLSAARNAGLEWNNEHLHCPWVTFIDSDDWIHQRYLEYLYTAAIDNNVQLSAGLCLKTKGEPLPNELEYKVSLLEPREYYLGNMVTVSWGKLYKTECFSDVRFPVGKIHEDEYTTYKILFKLPSLALVEIPLYAYFQNNEGITRKPWTPARLDVLPALENQIDFFLRIGYGDLAKTSFDRIFRSIKNTQKAIVHSDNLSSNEKDHYQKILLKKLRHILIKYYRYGWLRYHDSEEAKKVYAKAFRSIRIGRDIWAHIKPLVRKK